MGSPESEDWRSNDEAQHRVTLAAFYMAKFEVTQKEWREITGKNPGNFTGEKLPVESITWLEQLCKKSSFCLPCCPALKTKIDGKKMDRVRHNNFRLSKLVGKHSNANCNSFGKL